MDNDGSVTLTNGTGNWYDTYVAYAVNKGIIDAKYAEYGYALMNAEMTAILIRMFDASARKTFTLK